MRKRKFVGKLEIAGITQDITRRNWNSNLKVGAYYDALDDRFYEIQMMTNNSWFNPYSLDEHEIAVYFSGVWSMEKVVSETKELLEKFGFNPEFVDETDHFRRV